jgi:hypothetical protein
LRPQVPAALSAVEPEECPLLPEELDFILSPTQAAVIGTLAFACAANRDGVRRWQTWSKEPS